LGFGPIPFLTVSNVYLTVSQIDHQNKKAPWNCWWWIPTKHNGLFGSTFTINSQLRLPGCKSIHFPTFKSPEISAFKKSLQAGYITSHIFRWENRWVEQIAKETISQKKVGYHQGRKVENKHVQIAFIRIWYTQQPYGPYPVLGAIPWK